MTMLLRYAVCTTLLWSLLSPASAQDTPLNASLGERIETIKNDKLFPVDLVVTVFQPEGPGPFPVAMLHHGKSGGNAHLQTRNRPIPAVREFLKRGYVVVAPMRQGFAGSGGAAVGDGCNIEGNGNAQAEDVVAVVKWLKAQAWADTSRMLMAGQSHGGLTTMAYSQQPDAGFKLFVNFAGGLKYQTSCQWELSLRDAYARYGKRSSTTSIWFYGENDSYFPPPVIAPAFAAFKEAGGNGEMVAFGPFGADAHSMFGSTDGLPIWLPRVLAKMQNLGLPTEITLPKYGLSQPSPIASGYANVADVGALVKANANSEKSYRLFLTKPTPRAFAIAPKSGKQHYQWGGDNPAVLVLANCEKTHAEPCLLYAVDNTVVWKKP